MCVFLGKELEENRAANSVILLREKCVSEPRTASDRMCTDAGSKQSLCNSGSWTYSNRSRSNTIISHNHCRLFVSVCGSFVGLCGYFAPFILLFYPCSSI